MIRLALKRPLFFKGRLQGVNAVESSFPSDPSKNPLQSPLFGSGTWVTPFGDMGNTFMGCCPSDAGYEESPLKPKHSTETTSTGA